MLDKLRRPCYNEYRKRKEVLKMMMFGIGFVCAWFILAAIFYSIEAFNLYPSRVVNFFLFLPAVPLIFVYELIESKKRKEK